MWDVEKTKGRETNTLLPTSGTVRYIVYYQKSATQYYTGKKKGDCFFPPNFKHASSLSNVRKGKKKKKEPTPALDVNVDDLILLVGLLAMSRAPLFEATLLLQVLLPLESADPLVEDQGEIETKDHANCGKDSGNKDSLLAALIAFIIRNVLVLPFRVALPAAGVHLGDMVVLNSNVDNSPAKEHQEESPRGGNELAMVPSVTLKKMNDKPFSESSRS